MTNRPCTLHFSGGPLNNSVVSAIRPVEQIQVIEFVKDGSEWAAITIYEVDKEIETAERLDLYLVPAPFSGRV